LEFRATTGSEISFALIEDLIIDIRAAGVHVAEVNSDQVGRSTLQRLTTAGFETKYVSVDRNKDGYNELRRAVLEQRFIGPDVKKLIIEMIGLQSLPKKIDHPMLGSKDIADAVASSTWQAILSVEAGAEEFESGAFEDIMSALDGTGSANTFFGQNVPTSGRDTGDIFSDALGDDDFASLFE
jgi:hypothetical protein